MPDSIKKQICAAIQTALSALSTTQDGAFKKVERRFDPLQFTDVHPTLFWRTGPEVEIGKDNQGRTYRFPLIIATHFKGVDKLEQHDDLVAAIQDVIEGNIQLGGLVNVIDGGTEDPWVDDQAKDLGGSVIIYQVQYRRVRGAAHRMY